MMRMTEAVKQLLIITILFYIGSAFVGDYAYKLLAYHSPMNPDFRFWQPLTAIFMHSPPLEKPGLMHIVLNMFGLVMFGPILEQFWGAKKFVFFYISCGVGASLLKMGIDYYNFQHGLNILLENGENKAEVLKMLAEGKFYNEWETVMSTGEFSRFMKSYLITGFGASGALYGIMTAYAFMFPDAPLGFMFIPIEIKAKYFVFSLVTLDLILGMNGGSIFGGPSTNVGHFAHFGGALTGYFMMWYWKRNQFKNNRWH
ncbi:rhomboid family intramembrane serine protease [Flavobacterium sp.]